MAFISSFDFLQPNQVDSEVVQNYVVVEPAPGLLVKNRLGSYETKQEELHGPL